MSVCERKREMQRKEKVGEIQALVCVLKEK